MRNRSACGDGLDHAAWLARSASRLVAWMSTEMAAMRRVQASIRACSDFASSLYSNPSGKNSFSSRRALAVESEPWTTFSERRVA